MRHDGILDAKSHRIWPIAVDTGDARSDAGGESRSRTGRSRREDIEHPTARRRIARLRPDLGLTTPAGTTCPMRRLRSVYSPAIGRVRNGRRWSGLGHR
ncbi:hypothetical protein ABIB37_002009 [Agrococcus sp. UYP10]